MKGQNFTNGLIWAYMPGLSLNISPDDSVLGLDHSCQIHFGSDEMSDFTRFGA